MKYVIIIFLIILLQYSSKAQYAPAVGMVGSTAIHSDSNIFVAWANNCILHKSWQNAMDTTIGKVAFGSSADGVDKADGQAVSLGDGGSAILSFQTPITNGVGWDFAVFENAFNNDFLELAFVEVSSNGIDFVRFPAHSLSQADSQITAFGVINTSSINNLAGKYRIQFGTPFDLAELSNSMIVDVNRITHIRIIDVVGSINPSFGNLDTANNFINDPFPTPFPSSGFDLDAVGIINQYVNMKEQRKDLIEIFPNPTKDFIFINLIEKSEIQIYGSDGVLQLQKVCNKGQNKINISNLINGFYFIRINNEKGSIFKKIVKI